ncbi:MAG: hypothetical protein VXV96_06845 [Bdellovibrionota bacterium]|jgi:hypothetical protein|nr:hypothetical protein [Bdellovibrionota bacterium]
MKIRQSLIVLFFLCMVVFQSAHAEYRVFQFAIKAKNPFSLDQKSHIVTSTLDPQSYLAYHGGTETLSIDLMRTWMCRGDTSGQRICSPPVMQNETLTEVN